MPLASFLPGWKLNTASSAPVADFTVTVTVSLDRSVGSTIAHTVSTLSASVVVALVRLSVMVEACSLGSISSVPKRLRLALVVNALSDVADSTTLEYESALGMVMRSLSMAPTWCIVKSATLVAVDVTASDTM